MDLDQVVIRRIVVMKFRNAILSVVLSFIFVVTQFGLVHANQLQKNEKIDLSYLESVNYSSDKEIVILKLIGLDTVQYSERQQLLLQNKASQILDQPLMIDEAYAKKIQTKQIDLFKTLSSKVPMNLIHSYQYVYNGIAIEIRGYNLRFLLNNPQIEKIFSTRDVSFPVRDIAVVTISADKAWNLTDANQLPVTGAGIRVGILDSGIDFNHGDFTPQGMGPDKKVKYGYDFADNDSDPQDKGEPPHGTHVAGIASGKNPNNPLRKGVAPDSDLYVYKVFGSNIGSANPSNIVAAAEQAVKDKCHVINLSLGNSSPTESMNPGKPYYDSLNNAMKMGVVVCCASGNDGSRHKNNPWPIHAPGVFDSVIQVAATDDRMTQPITINMPGLQDIKVNANRSKYSPPFKAEQSKLPVVDCGFGLVEDFANVDVDGKIALISRGPKIGGIKYQEKNLNAKKAGAVGCIVYNYDPQPIGASLIDPAKGEDPYSFSFIPNLTISSQLADQLKYKLSKGGQLSFEDKSYITIADFSSVGPCFSGDKNFFKPEISAPGKQISSAVLATKDKNDNYTDQYQDWDGTSMATPAVTGCVALLRQAQPSYNAYDVKSVIMNTSDVLINPMNDDYFSYFYQGAGQINILNAIQSPVIIDPPALQRNITQLEKPFEFTIRNTSDKAININIKTETFNLHEDIDPIKYEINSPTIYLESKEKKIFTTKIQIKEEDFINRVYQGAIWIEIVNQKDLNKSIKSLHIPLVIYKDSITKIEPSITNLKISSFDLNYKSPINNKISFDLNTGSYLAYKGIEPPVNMYENQARMFRLYVVDAKGNDWGNIYYADNLPVGHYSVDWDGMNFSGSEFLPNGNFSIMAEISGVEYVIKDNKLESTKNDPEIFGSLPVLVSGSSVPQPPLLLVSAVSSIELNQEFMIDILFADVKDIQNVSITLLFSKTRTSPVGYTLGEFVDTSILNEKKDVKLDKGSFTIKAKRDPNAKGNRLKIASIRLKAEKITTSKTGIDLSIESFEFIDANKKVRKTYMDYPTIMIPKDIFIFGDFNEDGQVNDLDYNLLLNVYGIDYESGNWDKKFDLNNDYLINICDLVVFSKYYEKLG
jgi:minor extracellular serine protease Vpr